MLVWSFFFSLLYSELSVFSVTIFCFTYFYFAIYVMWFLTHQSYFKGKCLKCWLKALSAWTRFLSFNGGFPNANICKYFLLHWSVSTKNTSIVYLYCKLSYQHISVKLKRRLNLRIHWEDRPALSSLAWVSNLSYLYCLTLFSLVILLLTFTLFPSRFVLRSWGFPVKRGKS